MSKLQRELDLKIGLFASLLTYRTNCPEGSDHTKVSLKANTTTSRTASTNNRK